MTENSPAFVSQHSTVISSAVLLDTRQETPVLVMMLALSMTKEQFDGHQEKVHGHISSKKCQLCFK